MSSGLTHFTKVAKPIASVDLPSARKLVIRLYRMWIREIPRIQENFTLEYNRAQCVAKLREKFLENAHVRDPRAIDLLVFKGRQELDECVLVWKQRTHILRYFQDTKRKPLTKFMDRFNQGMKNL
ncbi:NADH-ubiquinone oxidoreductase subunit CI-B14 [Oopsacas minuta]|uniref:NADH dehydrogenase [ubiquinone] 1 alpha subcomplex subunit 6 n=1 Tax=Oopsacas minuta TaxID=111878 RepID=A0AAV7KAG6_9METZ|nr:NADH-ubiquinone oxidoreductase subunit CI-B14 [Oopsacas minuta]